MTSLTAKPSPVKVSPMNFDGFSGRLKEALGSTTPYAFAKKCGISESLVRKYLSGSSLPSIERAWVMARAAGVSLDWLADGSAPSPAAISQVKEDDTYAYVPLYDARCSAGNGAWNERSSVLVNLSFTRYSLRKKGLRPADLACLRVDGDSMTGLLEDGDTVMIDQRRNTLEGEGVYVVMLDDHLYAKRLQRQFDGSILIISHNTAYKEMTVPRDRLAELQIIGHVVWAGGWMI